jgi:hypothetical protein
VWFIAYRHSLRPNETGIKFVHGEPEAISERQRLEALGYVITNIAPTSKARMDAFLASTVSDPEQRLLS